MFPPNRGRRWGYVITEISTLMKAEVTILLVGRKKHKGAHDVRRGKYAGFGRANNPRDKLATVDGFLQQRGVKHEAKGKLHVDDSSATHLKFNFDLKEIRSSLKFGQRYFLKLIYIIIFLLYTLKIIIFFNIIYL